jgi:hypothetical protein
MRSWAMTWRRYLIDLAAIAVKEVHLLRGIMNSTEYPASLLLRTHPPPQEARPVPRGIPVGWSRSSHPSGLPVLLRSLYARMLPPLPRWNRWVHVSLTSPAMTAFLACPSSRLPHFPFRGLLSVHCTLQPAGSRSHLCDSFHQRLQPFRYLHDCSDCYRLERKLPGGSVSHWVIAPFHGARTCSGGASRIDGNWQDTVLQCQTFDPLPHPPIRPRGGGDAKDLASPSGFASFQSVQVFKADGGKPLPWQLFDGMVDGVVAGDARAPLALASRATATDPRRDLPPLRANRLRLAGGN